MELLFTWVFGFAHIVSGSFLADLADVKSRYEATSWSVEEDQLVSDIVHQVKSDSSIVLVSELQADISQNGFPGNMTNVSSSPPITKLQPDSLTAQIL